MTGGGEARGDAGCISGAGRREDLRAPEVRRAILASLIGVLLLGGCYGQRFDVLEQELAQTGEELGRLREEEKRREETIAALEDKARQYEEHLRLSRATNAARHREILERLSRLEAALSESDDRADLVAQQVGDARWQTVPADTAAAAGTEKQPTGFSVAPGAELRRAYEAARLDLTQGHYDLAASAFREFLRRFPDTELSDNAQYWLGECYYAQQKFADAMREFQRVIADYPRADKVPAAFLKMGFSLLAMGRREEAISLLKRVASEYPHTPEAERALERLRSLADEPQD